jgi:hypothetical protein
MENGGSAFPNVNLEHGNRRACSIGMSLRDYFACHIMESLVKPTVEVTQADADKAYQIATMMIIARDKEYIV